MPNPQGQNQGQGQSQERQPGESEQEYQERLQRTGAQGTGSPDADEAKGTQGR